MPFFVTSLAKANSRPLGKALVAPADEETAREGAREDVIPFMVPSIT